MYNPTAPDSAWQLLFEAALQEQDPLLASERFQSAKDAIMDHIEDSFEAPSSSDQRLLLAALNTITERQSQFAPDISRKSRLGSALGHAA